MLFVSMTNIVNFAVTYPGLYFSGMNFQSQNGQLKDVLKKENLIYLTMKLMSGLNHENGLTPY